MARHVAKRADRAEKCMFAAVAFADETAKRGYSSVSDPLSIVDVSSCLLCLSRGVGYRTCVPSRVRVIWGRCLSGCRIVMRRPDGTVGV